MALSGNAHQGYFQVLLINKFHTTFVQNRMETLDKFQNTFRLLESRSNYFTEKWL
jgi:hypothetical protein